MRKPIVLKCMDICWQCKIITTREVQTENKQAFIFNISWEAAACSNSEQRIGNSTYRIRRQRQFKIVGIQIEKTNKCIKTNKKTVSVKKNLTCSYSLYIYIYIFVRVNYTNLRWSFIPLLPWDLFKCKFSLTVSIFIIDSYSFIDNLGEGEEGWGEVSCIHKPQGKRVSFSS